MYFRIRESSRNGRQPFSYCDSETGWATIAFFQIMGFSWFLTTLNGLAMV